MGYNDNSRHQKEASLFQPMSYMSRSTSLIVNDACSADLSISMRAIFFILLVKYTHVHWQGQKRARQGLTVTGFGGTRRREFKLMMVIKERTVRVSHYFILKRRTKAESRHTPSTSLLRFQAFKPAAFSMQASLSFESISPRSPKFGMPMPNPQNAFSAILAICVGLYYCRLDEQVSRPSASSQFFI